MSWLEPCRIPLTAAPVCELQSVCQEVMRVAARAQPGGEVGHRAVADGAAGGVVGQRVDLQEEHAGRPLVGVVGRAGPAAGPAEEQLVAVDREQAADQPGHGGDRDADDHRDAEVGDVHPGDGEGERQHRGAQQQEAADAEGEERDRQRDPHDQRPDQRAEQAEQQGEDRRLPPRRQRRTRRAAAEQRPARR